MEQIDLPLIIAHFEVIPVYFLWPVCWRDFDSVASYHHEVIVLPVLAQKVTPKRLVPERQESLPDKSQRFIPHRLLRVLDYFLVDLVYLILHLPLLVLLRLETRSLHHIAVQFVEVVVDDFVSELD